MAQPASQRQQQPWWAEPLHGIGAAIQGMQANMQRVADGLARPSSQPLSTPRHASLTMAASSPTAAAERNSSSRSSSSQPHALDVATLSGKVSSRHQQHYDTKPVTKEELGKSTWVFLHTLAAQFPERPSRQQQRDARQLIDNLTRLYPCGECAQHFQELVKRDPPDVSSGSQFALWMCRTHNAVNRRLGKPTFNCELVAARWAPLDCDEHNSCDLTVGRKR